MEYKTDGRQNRGKEKQNTRMPTARITVEFANELVELLKELPYKRAIYAMQVLSQAIDEAQYEELKAEHNRVGFQAYTNDEANQAIQQSLNEEILEYDE